MKKALIGLVVVLVAAGGAGAWWHLTAVDRWLRRVDSGIHDAEVVWGELAQHPQDPRVRDLCERRLLAAAGNPNYRLDWMPPEALAYDAVFGARPLGDEPGAVRAAAEWWIKYDHASAKGWARGCSDPGALREALLAVLEDMAFRPLGWSERAERLAPPHQRLVSALEALEVGAEEPRFARAQVSLALRYELAAAQEVVEALAPDVVTDAVVAHLLRSAPSSAYKEGRGEVGRVMAALAAGRAPATDELLKACCYYGDDEATAAALSVLDPTAARRLEALRDQLGGEGAEYDKWLQGQVSRLISALGAGGAGDVDRIVEDLLRSREGRPAAQPSGPPLSPLLSVVRWGPKITARRVAGAVEDLVRIGPAAVPALRSTVTDRGADRARVHVAARALARLDPTTLVELVDEALDRYAPLARQREEEAEGQPVPEEFDAGAFVRSGTIVAEGLRALVTAPKEDVAVNQLLLETISHPDPVVADYALARLDERLPTEVLVPSLFAYLGVKPELSVGQIDTYVAVLVEEGPDGQPRAGVAGPLARAMAGLLEAAGSPEQVPWVHKIVGLRALARAGDASAAAVLERYAADTASYMATETRYEGEGASRRVVSHDEVERKFADLARQALEAARRR